MSSEDWKRPQSVPVGTVWDRFNGRPLPSGVVPRFLITDLTEDTIDAALQTMRDSYLKDEPLSRFIGRAEDPVFIEDLTMLWKWCLTFQLGLVCVVENADEIADMPKMAGCNITYPSFQEGHAPEPATADVQHYLNYAVQAVGLYDCFKHFNTPVVLSSFGLGVDRQWRGHKIGQHLLAARISLGRALGIPVTNGVFSSQFSQAAARKAGFEQVAEMKALEYLVDGKPYFNDPEITFEVLVAKTS